MKKNFPFLVLIALISCLASCKSDAEKANEVLSYAMEMNKIMADVSAADTGQLDIQHSTYSGPVKKVPTQEELIKKYKVKTVKEMYEGGWSVSTYDRKGNKISEESDYSGKKTFTYEFDKDGRIAQEKIKHKDGTVTTILYAYNNEGKLISRTYKDSEEKPSVTTFEYNAALNTRTESSELGIDKEFYDNRGLRVQFESYDEKEKLMGSGHAQYNEDGLKMSETAKILGLNNNDVFEYNEAGQLVKQHRTGMVDAYFIYEYNSKGLLTIHKNIKNGQEDVTRYEYVFY